MLSVWTTHDALLNGHWGLRAMTCRRPLLEAVSLRKPPQPPADTSPLLRRCRDAITRDRKHRWDATVLRYYSRLTPADGRADVKLDEIRRSVPPAVKRTMTSERWLQGRQARDACC